MKTLALSAALACLIGGAAQAATLTEAFNDPFIDWRSGFMGTESNLENYYVEANGSGSIGNRGNNATGLWIADGDGVAVPDTSTEILFNTAFAATITDLSFKMSTYSSGVSLQFFDKDGTTLSTTSLAADFSTQSLQLFSATSTNGIGGFRLTRAGGNIEGFTNIDDITVTTGAPVVGEVPLPAGFPLLLGGLAVFGWMRRSKSTARA